MMPNSKKDELHVRIASRDEKVTLSFFVDGDMHEMQRNYEEELPKTLFRLYKTCSRSKSSTGKSYKRNKKGDSDSSLLATISEKVRLTKDGSLVEMVSMTNTQFEDGMQISFDELRLQVFVNPPRVTSISSYPRTSCTIDCPVVPNVVYENADEYDCHWYVETSPKSGEYQFAAHDKIFYPQAAHIGCKLKLFATAKRRVVGSDEFLYGRSFVHYLSGVVLGMEREFLSQTVENQRKFVERTLLERSDPSHNRFRFVTYNILADSHSHAQPNGKNHDLNPFYWYAHPRVLDQEYRSQRIAMELLQLSADVIALQECEQKVFNNYLCPLLGSHGYSAHYTNKVAMQTEGCAIFVKNSAFKLVHVIDVPVKERLRQADYMRPFWETRPDLRGAITGKLGTIVQIILCESVARPGQYVIVGNTHLFYHALADYIRLLQMHVMVSRIEELVNDLKRLDGQVITPSDLQRPGDDEIDPLYLQLQVDKSNQLLPTHLKQVHKPSQEIMLSGASTTPIGVVVLGDLNSDPGSAAMSYLDDRIADVNRMTHAYSRRLSQFRMSGGTSYEEEEERTGASTEQEEQEVAVVVGDHGPIPVETFQHTLPLISTTREVKYSNYIAAFKAHLDHIHVNEDAFEFLELAPVASEKQMQMETALPSTVFPSDHVLLSVDVAFK